MTLKNAILATLAYHDIFDYPLRADEIVKYTISKKASQKTIAKALQDLKSEKKIGEKQGINFLKGRNKIVNIRKKREKYSKRKFKRARVYANLLKIVPSIKLVAVSGALAMENSHKNDDIDFVIISQKKALWTTRFFANILLWPFKRDPSGKNVSDRVCLNMFLDESALKIKEQNIYTAHEICQMKVLWGKNNTYERFLKENKWLWQYLPNWHTEKVNSAQYKLQIQKQKKQIIYQLLVFRGIVKVGAHISEQILRSFQLWYMKSKMTSEIVGNKAILLHPKNTKQEVLKVFSQKLKRLGVLGTFSRDLP